MNATRNYLRLLFLIAIGLHLGDCAQAAIIYVDGDDASVAANHGVFFDGTDTTVPSAFKTPELIKNQGNETKTSAAVVLTDVPFIMVGPNKFFQLILDSQETANNGGNPNRERVILTELVVYVGPDTVFANASEVWRLTPGNEVHVNDQTRSKPTNTPQSASGDMRLNIPFSLFPSGTHSNHFLFFRATQTDSDNGGEEWKVRNTGSFLAAATPVPEPSTAMLGSLAILIGFFGFRTGRR